MIAWYAIVFATLLAAGPALADSADVAFVIGKPFAFNCFDGSRGAVRIYDNGSVIGTIQFQGSGAVRSVWLPAGTLKVKGEAVCASLEGIPTEPCFDLSRTDDQSFRGSVSGLSSAYCDFTQRASVGRPAPLSFEETPVE
jgi:hypothetical protein